MNELYRAALLVWKSSPGWAIASIALVIPQGILPLASLYIMKLIVDCVASGYSSANKEAVIGQISMLIALAILLELLSILISVLDKLLPEDRVLWQCMVRGDKKQDIANKLHITVDGVYYREKRLRGILRTNPELKRIFEKG